MADLVALHPMAAGLRLYKIVKEDLVACEPIYFVKGRDAVDTVLRRAAIYGRAEVEGDGVDFFADVLTDHDGSWEQTAALDRGSYGALKNKWMRCRLARAPGRNGRGCEAALAVSDGGRADRLDRRCAPRGLSGARPASLARGRGPTGSDGEAGEGAASGEDHETLVWRLGRVDQASS